MEWLTSIFSGIGTKIIELLFRKKPDNAINNNNTISVIVNEGKVQSKTEKESPGITIKYALINIKVKGSRKQCEEGKATVIYLGSFLVNSPSKSIYQDFVEVAPESKIESVKFIPKEMPLDKDQFKRNHCIFKYGIIVPDDGFIAGEVIIKQALREKAGGIGFHTPPYYTKELVFNIDLSEVDFICEYERKAKLKTIENGVRTVKEIETNFYDKSNTHVFRLKNVPANSNIAFEWENNEVQ